MTSRWRSAMAVSVLAGLAACHRDAPPWPEPPPVAIALEAKASAATVPLLSEFAVRLDLFRRADVEVDFDPQVPAGCTGSVQLQPEQPFGNGRWRTAVLHLRPVQGPGPLKIAPFKAVAKDGSVSGSTPELHVDVTSLLAGHDAALEVPAAPMLPPMSRWWWAVALGAPLLVLLSLRAWRARRRRPRAAALAVAVRPHIKALRELARLRAQPRRSTGEIEAFYVATSQVLRVYLEERFGLRAPERTTEEFLAEVEAGGPLSTAQCLELRRFLQQCDLVKFAAQTPREEVHLQTLAIAELLVESTRPDRTPLEASA